MHILRHANRALLLAILLMGLPSCMSRASHRPPIDVAPRVDLNRMYGGWYILATIPNWFEKGLVAPYEVYSPYPAGGIREDFYVRSGSFTAPLEHHTVHDWVEPGSNNARWRVQIVWPFKFPFLLLYTDPEYQYALFGEENRSAGWIYARDPNMDDTTYRSLLDQFKIRGYDPSQFRRWIQTPEQIGMPGFWSDGIHR